ncbi:EF-hand domain-containing protein [Sphingomonas sp. IW22]|uniref:EF-hand domain-containing protein n=1 Tax=Sphingomonas sp. IW22 TaxID=3242489 RepID=UPI00351FEDF6
MKRPKMPRIVIAAALGSTVLASTAFAAQQTPPAGARMRMQPPATQEEAISRADQHFTRLDTNRDGQVTQAEVEALRQQRAERREARAQKMGKRGGKMAQRMLTRLDTDRNGSVSQAEFRAGATQRFQRIDSNGDGRLDAAETQAMRDKRMSHRGMRGHGGAPTPPTGN